MLFPEIKVISLLEVDLVLSKETFQEVVLLQHLHQIQQIIITFNKK
jgi:hypothetical protein